MDFENKKGSLYPYPKAFIEYLWTDDNELQEQVERDLPVKEPIPPVKTKVLVETLPISHYWWDRDKKIDDKTFARVAGNILSWKKGVRYSGCNYTNMVNDALGTDMHRYTRATFDIGVYLSNCEALFAFFDGIYRQGSAGSYKNVLINQDTYLEVCAIDDYKEYKRIKTAAPSIRFVFKRDPDMTGENYLCELIGIFKCERKDIYLINGKYYQGELTYKRYVEYEQLWQKKVAEAENK